MRFNNLGFPGRKFFLNNMSKFSLGINSINLIFDKSYKDNMAKLYTPINLDSFFGGFKSPRHLTFIQSLYKISTFNLSRYSIKESKILPSYEGLLEKSRSSSCSYLDLFFVTKYNSLFFDSKHFNLLFKFFF